ncbi:hypothetical protein V866_007737 [Kwoniella sp. B9012]
MSITPSLPQLTTTPPPPDPPRRRFGSATATAPKTADRPSFSSSSISSPALIAPPPDVQRTRSASSASSTASGPNTPTQGQGGFDIGLAADKAQQWLSTWAPRGEGRSREFLTNTLNGVANVASQVSNNLNREGFGSRSNSFASASTPSVQGQASIPSSPEERFGGPAAVSGSALSISPSPNPLPPIINHTTSTPALPVQRKIPQPANLSRLGHSNSTTSTPITTTGSSALTSKLNGSANGSTSSLPLHGPSHLNPNAPSIPSGHRRNSSTASNPSSHRRTSSFGISLGKSPSISRSASLTKQATTKSAGMPYKIGFQPQGVKHDRTEEFVRARKIKGEEREREEGRLGRRWAKLVDLHFNPTVPNPLPTVPTLTRSSSSTFSISSLASGSGGNDCRKSLLSIDGALDALKPKDVWKGFKSGPGPGGEEGKKRAAEQAIVKWEDDSEVKKCRICQSSFSLSNRKHHCRLCGRIICALPPTPPALLAVQIQLFAPANPEATSTNSQGGLPPGTRREKCSLLLVADWKTGRGEEVEEGFVGWMKMDEQSDQAIHPTVANIEPNQKSPASRTRRSRLSTNSISSSISEDRQVHDKERSIPLPQQPKEVQVKGCRVCRECWSVVSRKQKMQDRQRVTGFARLYSALRSLQSNIEELMPEFEDLLADLTESDNPLEPSPEVLSIHKQLLTLLTQYEHLSKRIGGLTCEEGSSQAIVQSAVARSAAGFLAREMVKLQTLQKLQKRAANAKRKSLRIHELTLSDSLNGTSLSDGSGTTTPTSELLVDKEIEDVAVVLQPLLEQEAQLEVYISDANSQRKYEDSKALNQALREIRLEIERITQRAK